MRAEVVQGKKLVQEFLDFPVLLYKNDPCFRNTEGEIASMITRKHTVFAHHAVIMPFLVRDATAKTVCRFCLIEDEKLPGYVQIAFFEAYSDIQGLEDCMIQWCREYFPQAKKIVAGLNAHLNYGAGFLTSRFDLPPVFGLPYGNKYYLNYFKSYEQKKMFSFRYPVKPFFEYFHTHKKEYKNPLISVRTMQKKQLKREVAIYTRLNNAGFTKHPYWSDRTEEEDYELFKPFSLLLDEENLLFAEIEGKPVGFLLWYPDFNELVRGSSEIGLGEWLKFRFFNPIRSFRFTEFGVLPEYRGSGVVDAMIRKLAQLIRKTRYQEFEGGFIFEENAASISVALRYALRTMGTKLEPYREYSVFEKTL